MDAFKLGKIVPVLLSGYLTYTIAVCPCDELMKCTKGRSLMLITALALMTIFGWPMK